jgi:hypothetical protein
VLYPKLTKPLEELQREHPPPEGAQVRRDLGCRHVGDGVALLGVGLIRRS